MARWSCIIGIGLVACCSTPAWGQGKSQGRGLGVAANAGKAASSAGAAADKGVHAGLSDSGKASRSTSMGKTASGLSQGSGAKKIGLPSWLKGGKKPQVNENVNLPPSELPSQAQVQQNFERIEQKRLEQSEHLRQLGVQNGNQHLAATADRMQQSAEANYQRQMQRFGENVVAPESTPVATQGMAGIPAIGPGNTTGALPGVQSALPGTSEGSQPSLSPSISPTQSLSSSSNASIAREAEVSSSATAAPENKNIFKRTSESIKKSFSFKSKK